MKSVSKPLWKDLAKSLFLGFATFLLLPFLLQGSLSYSAIHSLARFNPLLEREKAHFSIPERRGWVTDSGSFLTLAEQDQLASMLAGYYQRSGRTFYILLVPSLQGVSIEEFSERVFNIWKIGREKEDDGLLLVLAPNERKTRLEVGYGLEGEIPDIRAKQYIVLGRGDFQAGRFEPGLVKIISPILQSSVAPSTLVSRVRLSNDDTDAILYFLMAVFFACAFPVEAFFIYGACSFLLTFFLLGMSNHSYLYALYVLFIPLLIPVARKLNLELKPNSDPIGSSFNGSTYFDSDNGGSYSGGGDSSGGSSGGGSGGGGASDSW